MTFLIDGDAYFQALRVALLSAREQVIILGWDVDGRLDLARGEADAESPSRLRDLLNFVAERRPELRIFILLWDFAVLYALEREPLPSINLNLRTAPGIRAILDNTAPIGGSRHEKIVVIDDRLAFCGGLDLTDARWDTPAHGLDDERRVRVSGAAYDPFHDLQVAVDDEAAAALGEHCRDRWERVTGERLPSPKSETDAWPKVLSADVRDVEVAVARTRPCADDDAGVREIEQLYLDAIDAARRYVYIENQYFTSDAVADAIARRLREADGPEFILVGPRSCEGWLEERTMGLLRQRFVARLRSYDRYQRFGMFTPLLDEETDNFLMVHSKVFICDDHFARIGSSNLTNRSMGLDTECDLAIEAHGDEDPVCTAIRDLRNRLLAEHLDLEKSEVDVRISDQDSLLRTIEMSSTGSRRLEPCAVETDEVETVSSLIAEVGDPPQPLLANDVVEEFCDKISTGMNRYPGLAGLIALGALGIGLGLAWRYTSLADYVSIDGMRVWVESLRTGGALVPVLMLAAYVVGGLVAFPVMVLNAATAIAFGPWLGFAYALSGSLVSATATFAIGRRLGSGAIRRFSSGIVYKASRAISDRGFLAVLSCRLIPVAPFTVVNLVAGAISIRYRDYLTATLIGMIPGIAVLAAFGYQIERVLESPTIGNVITLGAVVLLWIGLGFLFDRLLRKTRTTRKRSGGFKDSHDPVGR